MKAMRIQRRLIFVFITLIVVTAMMSGCESWSGFIGKLKGDLVGNNYTITEYDNFGKKVMTVHGKKVSLTGLSDGSGDKSSYVNITIDGHEWQHVGGTLVFAQDGVDMITDFQIPTEITTDTGDSTGYIPLDKIVNSYKNLIGRKMVVVVYSQTGAPVGLFQGDSCYYEIPGDLPKTTMLSIDGKLVYVHRANIDILPAALLK